jgi:hypothetical protein
LYQILLTTDSSFNPGSQLDLQQSQCSEVGLPPVPPGLLICTDAIVNGNFEDDLLMSEWHYSTIGEQVTRTSTPHWFAPSESFSMVLPDTSIGGLPRNPWLWQGFEMPTWVITPTANAGARLMLKAHVGVNPEGSPEADELFVQIQDSSGLINVTPPITLATGADTPTLNPNLPENANWIFRQFDLGKYIQPSEDILNYRGQDLRLYFSAPNAGGDSTRFYLDNVGFEICNSEPSPTTFTTKVAGEARVLVNGIPSVKPGILLWIYAIDGEMQKTYTIHDSTFSFYDLPATAAGTTYVLYGEYFEDGNFYSASTILLLKQGQSIEDLALLLF